MNTSRPNDRAEVLEITGLYPEEWLKPVKSGESTADIVLRCSMSTVPCWNKPGSRALQDAFELARYGRKQGYKRRSLVTTAHNA